MKTERATTVIRAIAPCRLVSLISLLCVSACAETPDSLDQTEAVGVESAELIQSCTIKTINGRYLTAVGGGGRITDVIHSDATKAGSWEQFRFVETTGPDGQLRLGIRTKNGQYLTAVGGGGRITDVIHSDATVLRDWEKFRFHGVAGYFALETINGHFLTAVDGGGRITDTVHSDATAFSWWELFTITCTVV